MCRSGLVFFAFFAFAILPEEAAMAAEAPSSAKEFIVFCRTQAEACRAKIIAVDNENLMIKGGLADKPASQKHACWWGKTWGAPGHETLSQKAKAVLDWLNDHPEESGLTTDDAINDAIAALWPC
jgi:hypothetical protein